MVVGEVAPNFYGRTDLAKYPLGMATVENFIVDYKGGLFNRPGTEMLWVGADSIVAQTKFSATDGDLLLLFSTFYMYVIREGAFVPGAETSTGTNALGNYTGTPFTDGQLVYVEHETFSGAHFVSVAAGVATFETCFGDKITGAITATSCYRFSHGLALSIETAAFWQDDKKLIITSQNMAPKQLVFTAANSWAISDYIVTLAGGPTGINAAASDIGDASVSYIVTAVVNGVESYAAATAQAENVVNMTLTTGHINLDWTAVSGATEYRIYRSLVFPDSPWPSGAEHGYIGKTTGLTYQDPNITPDFTKTPPKAANYFDASNYPRLYARFQQRGVFSGMAIEPLTVVGTNSAARNLFSVSENVIATDAFKYEVDAQTLKPIKHMIPLRYGLMLFTSDTILQLYGGSETRALTATSAQVDLQSVVSVSEMKPVAINLDLIFMSAQNTELNAMLYTEYTNSFKVQDLLVLSSHLFEGKTRNAFAVEWVAEPHKVLHFLRYDGRRVTLTYERNQEVFGWARQTTEGYYRDMTVLLDDEQKLPYYRVERYLRGEYVMCIEREKPRMSRELDKQWFVDCGAERPQTAGLWNMRLEKADKDWATRTWTGTVIGAAATLPVAVGDRLYINSGIFEVTATSGKVATLRELFPPLLREEKRYAELLSSWHHATPTITVTGLWWLEGETVSILADGDAYIDIVVENYSVEVTNAAGHIVVGLPYTGKAYSLPVGLEGYTLNGKKLALRSVDVRSANSRGLSVGPSPEDLQEFDSGFFDDWTAPLSFIKQLSRAEFFGGSGWDEEARICIEQRYPLAADLLCFNYDLDVGG